MSPKARAKISASTKARLASPEARAKLSIALKIGWESEEAKANHSAASKVVWESTERRAEKSAATKMQMLNPKMRAAASAVLNSPKTRAKLVEIFNSPEVKAKRSVDAKLRMENLEYRAKCLAALNSPEAVANRLVSIASPEYKAKLSKTSIQAIIDGKIGFKSRGQRPNYVSKAGIQYTFRSTWELKTAEYFDAQDILWEYELEILILDGEAYLPDFFIFDEHGGLVKIVEVKGWLPPNSKAKLIKFQERLLLQGIILEIWDEPVLKTLGILRGKMTIKSDF